MKAILKAITVYMFISVIPIDLPAQGDSTQPLPHFLFRSFRMGVVKMKNGDSYTRMLNYNIIDGEMIFVGQGSYMAIDNINTVESVQIDNRTFTPVENEFFELVYGGAKPFFIQHKGRYYQEGTATAYGMTSPTNERAVVTQVRSGGQFRTLEAPLGVKVRYEVFYWVGDGSEMRKFRTERQFIKLFPGKEDDLKAFIKKNAVDISRSEDLVKLAEYFNKIGR